MTTRTLKQLEDCARGIRGMNERLYQKLMKKGLEWYLDVLIIRHFAPGYGRKARWRPNTREYQDWKNRNYGGLPQLVLSGRLARSARKGKVKKIGSNFSITWKGRAGTIGKYQIRSRRDWSIPSKRDNKDILRRMTRELRKIREKVPGIRFQ